MAIHLPRTATRKLRLTLEVLEDRTVPTALVAVTDANELFLFDSATPATGQRISIPNLAGSDKTIVAIDFGANANQLLAVVAQPSDDFIFADHHLYTIDVPSGNATQLTTQPLNLPHGRELSGDADYLAATNELRIVTQGITLNGQGNLPFSYRINASTFTVAVDPTPERPSGSPNQNLFGLASHPSYAFPFVLDLADSVLSQLSPATGEVTSLGSLLNVSGAQTASMDIAADGTAFGMFQFSGGGSQLATISLGQGNATLIPGTIGGTSLSGKVTEIAVRESVAVAPLTGSWAPITDTNTPVGSATITFTEPVQNVRLSDFTLNSLGLNTLSAVTLTQNSPSSYTINGLGQHTSNGNPERNYFLAVAATNGIRSLNNAPLEGLPTEQWRMDTKPPAVTITQAPGQTDPSSASGIEFLVTFSEPVTGFDSSDVTRGGTAQPTFTDVFPLDATRYSVLVSGMSRLGTVTVTIAANRVTDLLGNGNAASVGGDSVVTYDPSVPPPPPPPPPPPVERPPTLTGNITGMVRAALESLGARRRRGRMQLWTFTNTTRQTIEGPLLLVLEQLKRKVRLANQAGTFTLGKFKQEPFLIWDGTLSPGQSATFVLAFTSANGATPRYGWRLIAGAS